MIGILVEDQFGAEAATGDEAIALNREALSIVLESLGADHPDAAIVTGSLATSLQAKGDCAAAEPLFREALELDPNNSTALKHHFMVLAETSRWAELRASAQSRLTAAPWDPWAWLGLGLANHRLGRVADATAAFDSAMTYLTPEDRERYNQLGRVLAPKDAARIDTASNVDDTRKMYWLMSDPLWLAPGNEVTLEFLARIAYSEFKWTDETYPSGQMDTTRMHEILGYPQVGWKEGFRKLLAEGPYHGYPPTYSTARM